MEYQPEQHSLHWIVYQIIWCPKRRRKILVGPMPARLHQMIEQMVQEHGWQMLELVLQLDPVHLFLHRNPYTMPTALARLIKGRSSHTLREIVPLVAMHAVRLNQEHVLEHRRHRE